MFRERPAVHRFPANMAKRVHELAVYVRDTYDGDAARVWTEAADAGELRANLAALPGFGEMKIKALGAVLAKRFGVEAAQELVPRHPTLGDVDSAQALADYQAAKRVHKAEWSKAPGLAVAVPGRRLERRSSAAEPSLSTGSPCVTRMRSSEARAAAGASARSARGTSACARRRPGRSATSAARPPAS